MRRATGQEWHPRSQLWPTSSMMFGPMVLSRTQLSACGMLQIARRLLDNSWMTSEVHRGCCHRQRPRACLSFGHLLRSGRHFGTVSPRRSRLRRSWRHTL